MTEQEIFTTNSRNKKVVEVLTTEFTHIEPIRLLSRLLAAAVIYGMDRVETAIKHTFTKDISRKIIYALNFSIAAYVEKHSC